jgi:MYXO-CTERM domain-containing protein
VCASRKIAEHWGLTGGGAADGGASDGSTTSDGGSDPVDGAAGDPDGGIGGGPGGGPGGGGSDGAGTDPGPPAPGGCSMSPVGGAPSLPVALALIFLALAVFHRRNASSRYTG